MALFGAPVAHEDDPERAVRAALAIRRLRARGEGSSCGSGSPRARRWSGSRRTARAAARGMASGDVVNTAARLQAAAPVNGILVERDDVSGHQATPSTTRRRRAGRGEGEGRAGSGLGGARGARPLRRGRRASRTTELVGRQRELADPLATRSSARGRSASPSSSRSSASRGWARAGSCTSCRGSSTPSPELITWRQGRCLAYGDGVAFWALAEMVKAQAGIHERDTEDEAARSSAAGSRRGDRRRGRCPLGRVAPPPADRGSRRSPALGGDRRGEAFAAWRRYLEALAEQRPLVLVFEDLHWADDGLLDFVDELVDWLRGRALLVVCSARPELLERRPGWGGGKLNASTHRALAALPASDGAC